jgi:protein disulfide-isomerase
LTTAAPEQHAAVAMRSIFYSLLSLATIASTLVVPDNAATAVKRADGDDDWEEKTPDTIFNGQTVPPMPVLDSKTLDKEIGKGNW